MNFQRLDNIDDPLECYLQITSDVEVANQLKDVYRKVKFIDAIMGIQAEDKVPEHHLEEQEDILLQINSRDYKMEIDFSINN